MITLDLSEAIRGCERIQRRLAAIEHVTDHAGDLMKHWRVLMEQGNLRGVLEGTDKDGNPMLPVTYRPRFSRANYGGAGKPAKLTVSQRLGQHPRAQRGDFYGIGSHMSGVNNNLTSSRVSQARWTAPGTAAAVLQGDHQFQDHDIPARGTRVLGCDRDMGPGGQPQRISLPARSL